jgi:hypothetical protein
VELRHRGGAGCRAAILALALVMGGPIILAAQATGAVEGRVVSEVGEALGGAEIRLEPSEGGTVRRVESDRTGAFRIGFLAPGSYLLSTRRIGYRPGEPLLVSVGVGATIRLTLTLVPVPVALDSLVVSAPRVTLTRRDTEFATRLTARELAILPTFNDARSLVAFTPGARPDQIWGAASAQANLYLLDGISVNHPGLGGDFLQPSVTWIDQVEVRGLGAGAETGNFQGGVVNYITKSGTNRLEGQVRATFESHRLNGSNLGLTEVGSEPGSRYELDGQLRGPLVRDRLHFALFGQLIGRDQRVQNQVPQRPAGLVEPAPDFTERKLLGKLRWRPAGGDLLQAELGRLELDGDPAGLTGFESPEAAIRQTFRVTLPSFGWNHTWSERSNLDFRIGGFTSRDDRDPLAGGAVPGLLTLQDVGALAFQNAVFGERRRASSVDFSLAWSVGTRLFGLAHDLRIGAQHQIGTWDFTRSRTGGMTWRPFDRRVAPFWDPADPASWYSQDVIASTWGGETRLDSRVENSALFLQDYIEVTPRVRLNPGLRLGRWVGRLTPTNGRPFTAATDHALEPRVGLVVDLDRHGSLVAKAHWGRFHQGMFAAFFDRADGADGFSDEQRWNYQGAPFTDPRTRFTPAERDQLATQGLFELVQTISLSETGRVEGYRQPYVDQALIGLEKTFGDSWKAQALYVRRRNRNMVALVDRNLASNWTEFRDVRLLTRFFTPIRFEGEDLVLDRMWISNQDIMYWWAIAKSDPTSCSPTRPCVPPGMTPEELEALTYDPDYVVTTVPEARREFDQLQLTLEARFPNWWAGASAAISRLEGNFNAVTGPDDYTTGGAGPWVRPNEQLNFEGPLNNQSRLELKIQAGGLLPWGFRGGAFLTFFEGDRVTPTLTINPLLMEMSILEPGGTQPTPFRGYFLNGQAGHRIFIRSRGAFQYPSRAALDLHLERSVLGRSSELVVTVDAFNLLGDDALTSIETSVNGLWDAFSGSSPFGATRGRMAPRALRLGALYRF